MQRTYVIYHGNCLDGFGSALAAWKRFGSNAEYLPAFYSRPLPDHFAPMSRIYLLDFSFPAELMAALGKQHQVIMLDHHKTAAENLKNFPQLDFNRGLMVPDQHFGRNEPGVKVYFDMQRCGATIAWNFFHPETVTPDLFLYLEDRDLGKNALAKSHEVSAALQNYPYDFLVWDRLLKAGPLSIVEEGRVILGYIDVLAKTICQNASDETILGHKIKAVNATSHWTEVGYQLLKQYPDIPFAASYYFDRYGGKNFSLRSRGDFDVSKIALHYGGGGHPSAAGFLLKPGQSL